MKKAAVVLFYVYLTLFCNIVHGYAQEIPNVTVSTLIDGTEYVAEVYYYREDGTQCETALCEGVVWVVTIYLENGQIVRIEEHDLSEQQVAAN